MPAIQGRVVAAGGDQQGVPGLVLAHHKVADMLAAEACALPDCVAGQADVAAHHGAPLQRFHVPLLHGEVLGQEGCSPQEGAGSGMREGGWGPAGWAMVHAPPKSRFPMKQIPIDSPLVAVPRPASAARLRTSSFRIPPKGNKVCAAHGEPRGCARGDAARTRGKASRRTRDKK